MREKFTDSGSEDGKKEMYFKCIYNADAREPGGTILGEMGEMGELRITPDSWFV